MDISAIFDIGAAGMNLQRVRLEVAAANLANAQTTAPGGIGYRPLQVVVRGALWAGFESALNAQRLAPAEPQVVASTGTPRLVYEPGHPDADSRGFVSYPAVNPVSEMVRLIEISRAYEANVRAMNLARGMAQRALEIGSAR
jgi:flagellar basal-body rod protein FlgC